MAATKDTWAHRQRTAGFAQSARPLGHARKSIAAALDPASGTRLGALLLAVTAAVPLLSIWSLDRSANGRLTVSAVAATALFVALATVAVAERHNWRVPVRAMLMFPLLGLTALAVIAALTDGVDGAFVGLLVLFYVYVGLTQPRGSSLLLLPPTTVTWVLLNGDWSGLSAVRLLIAMTVWVTVGELLADRTTRLNAHARTLVIDAEHDALTGLRNRRNLAFYIDSLRVGDTVVLVDLDHFKAVNDTHGHVAGDRVLAEFTSLVRSVIRSGDPAVRYGGEEVLLLLSQTDGQGARRLLERLRARWAQRSSVTFSSGIAVCTAGVTGRAVIEAADAALYAAKAAGRNQDRTAGNGGQPIRAMDSQAITGHPTGEGR